jgi:hypothetical protein
MNCLAEEYSKLKRMVALDLENQFFQVRLHPDMKKFFGFQVPDLDGRPRYYCFNVMPYGCKPALAIVTRLLKPLKAFFHRLGINFSTTAAFPHPPTGSVNSNFVLSYTLYS